MAGSIHSNDATGHGREDVINVFIHQHDFAIEVSVLHSDSSLANESRKKIDILVEIGIPGPFRSYNQHPSERVLIEKREGDGTAKISQLGCCFGKAIIGVTDGFFEDEWTSLLLHEANNG